MGLTLLGYNPTLLPVVWKMGSSRYQLAICLSVCRQIYAEARLLPFKENVFVSDPRGNDANLAFIRELNPVQASAIGGLSFSCFNGFPQLSEADATRLAGFH